MHLQRNKTREENTLWKNTSIPVTVNGSVWVSPVRVFQVQSTGHTVSLAPVNLAYAWEGETSTNSNATNTTQNREQVV